MWTGILNLYKEGVVANYGKGVRGAGQRCLETGSGHTDGR